jgi:hypothetical protein
MAVQYGDDDQQFAGEAAGSRQADAGQSEEQEEAGQPRHAAHHAAELRDVGRAGSALQEGEHQKATTGGDAEIEQLQQRALQRRNRERGQAEHHQPDVRQARIRQHAAQIAVRQRCDAAVENRQVPKPASSQCRSRAAIGASGMARRISP